MFNIKIKPYTLNFRFDATTSRGTLNTKQGFYVYLSHSQVRTDKGASVGVGEIPILAGLSPDDRPDFAQVLDEICEKINKTEDFYSFNEIIKKCALSVPAVAFGLETALMDMAQKGTKIIFKNDFSAGKAPIAINGLIWMGTKEFMYEQIKEKIKENHTCIKLKIGAIDFQEELNLLKYIREQFTADDMILRVDANGAFAPKNALEKLKQLSEFEIHSIEQPIKNGQINEMASLCQNSPVPIALDEELISAGIYRKKRKLIQDIKPQFLVLKPSLLGGFEATDEFVDIAEENCIGWWATSALEGNIGLNAIAQWTASKNYVGYQGLGTGQLYENNVISPLKVENGYIYYDNKTAWGEV